MINDYDLPSLYWILELHKKTPEKLPDIVNALASSS
jgi:hypothetical protein